MNEHFKDPERKPEGASESDDLQELREQSFRQPAETVPDMEEVLRRDAQTVEVPDRVAERLERSIRQEEAARPQSWWKRIFNWS